MRFPINSIPNGDMTIARRVWRWMQYNAKDFDNATSLAETAAHEALPEDNDHWLDDSAHWVWDLAIEVIP